MSTFPPLDSYLPGPKPTSGMAIASLVCAILGLLIPGLGFIGVVLGVVALSNTRPDGAKSGRGLAIAGIVVGAVSLILGIALCAGIMLPALGKARQAAREIASQAQLSMIGKGLILYSQDNKDFLPEVKTGWETRLTQYGVVPQMVDSPRKPEGWTGPSYIYVPLSQSIDRVRFPGQHVLMYEDPSLDRDKTVPVLFLDGSVRIINEDELATMLEQQAVEQAKIESGESAPGADKP